MLAVIVAYTSQVVRRQADRLLTISGEREEREKCARMQGNFMLQHITCHSEQTLIASVVYTSAKMCEDTNSSSMRAGLLQRYAAAIYTVR